MRGTRRPTCEGSGYCPHFSAIACGASRNARSTPSAGTTKMDSHGAEYTEKL
ncbi:unnamed protein product, partial [Nesidiocoris tenuis]